MPAVSIADYRDRPGMAACGQPVEQLGADGAARTGAIGGVGRPCTPGNHEHDAPPGLPGDVYTAKQPLVRCVERVLMQVYGEVGAQYTGAQTSFPMGIKPLLRGGRRRGAKGLRGRVTGCPAPG